MSMYLLGMSMYSLNAYPGRYIIDRPFGRPTFDTSIGRVTGFWEFHQQLLTEFKLVSTSEEPGTQSTISKILGSLSHLGILTEISYDVSLERVRRTTASILHYGVDAP